MKNKNMRNAYVLSHKDSDITNNNAENLEWVPVKIDHAANDNECIGQMRDCDEILEYMREAFDKVWLTRTHHIDNIDIEETRLVTVNRIVDSYDDIPKDGYTDWECGYWNGILGALRWVIGDEKDFLDT